MMRVVFPILACVVLTLGHSSIGFAQICEGTQDFTPGARLRLEATAARFGHATDGHILSLGLSGGASVLFGSVRVGRASFTELGYAENLLDISVGARVVTNSRHTQMVCPFFLYEREATRAEGDNLAPAIFFPGSTVTSVGASYGRVVGTYGGVTITPFVSSAIGRVSSLETSNNFPAALGLPVQYTTTHETLGLARLGAGILVNRRVSVIPLVVIPIGVADKIITVQVTAAFTIGR